MFYIGAHLSNLYLKKMKLQLSSRSVVSLSYNNESKMLVAQLAVAKDEFFIIIYYFSKHNRNLFQSHANRWKIEHRNSKNYRLHFSKIKKKLFYWMNHSTKNYEWISSSVKLQQNFFFINPLCHKMFYVPLLWYNA